MTVRAAAWPDADQHVPLTRADEVPTLEVLAALLTGVTSPTGAGQVWAVASALADVLLQGRYVAVFADAEPRRALARCRLDGRRPCGACRTRSTIARGAP